MNIFNTKLHILSQKLGGSVLKKNIDLAKVSSEEFNSLPDGEGCSDPHRVLFALGESLFLISLLTIFFSFGCSKSSEQAPINPITGTQNTIPSSFLSREEILAIPTQNRKVGSFQLGVKKRIEDLDNIDVDLSRTPYDRIDLVPNPQRHLTHDYLFLDLSGVIETFITTNKEFETYMYRSLGNL